MSTVGMALNADWLKALDRRRLVVSAGAHSGASVELDYGAVSVGSAPDNDVVLFADHAEDHHFRLDISKGLLGKMVIHAVEGPVTLGNGRTVGVGEYCELAPGTTIGAGGAAMIIENPVDTSNLIAPALKVGIVGLTLAGAYVAWTLVSGLAATLPSIVSIDSIPGGRQLEQQIREAVDRVQPRAATLDEAFLWSIRTKLEDMGLNRRIRATEGAENTIRLTGTITEAEAGPYNEFLRWYDTRANAPKLIREVGRGGSEPELPKLRSVWLNGTPTAYFDDGTEAVVGDKLRGDWSINEINATGIVLERDGSSVVLTF